ncbi:hypothetical protein KIN20_012333 [Parelaphostrongylus tenuis]|uniref:Uncharacterized protein n=1 Tax=Parelaphostrongylus tenuis TaxID=148309 RepID=A0AAD5MAJ4_PARTN|nr:hypothetical protein KIN20_012333 [Parelaphostrongylus tenuis]
MQPSCISIVEILPDLQIRWKKMMPCANQVEYHPHFTRDELKKYCNKEGIFIRPTGPVLNLLLQITSFHCQCQFTQRFSSTDSLIERICWLPNLSN